MTNKIMIVDDDRVSALMVETALIKKGFNVLTAADGEKAWAGDQGHPHDRRLQAGGLPCGSRGVYSGQSGYLFRFKPATNRSEATLDAHYTSLWPE